MQILLLTAILACSFSVCSGDLPERPKDGALPFMVYFESRSRAMCVGVLVSRMVVMTAAVCVISIHDNYLNDRRPINVVVGTPYRHPMRGIKVPVNRVLMPKISNDTGARAYMMEKSVALLLLQRRIPDVLTEVPLRAIQIDYKGEETLKQQDECLMIGWHFYYQGEPISPSLKKFVLQRNLRYQHLNLVNKEMYCDTLVLKYEKSTDDLGHVGAFMKNDVHCLRDPTNSAQPCHVSESTYLRTKPWLCSQGMYGAPMICSSGTVVGMLMAPAAQWDECTGFSVLAHELSNMRNKDFFDCIHPLFEPEMRMDWSKIKEHTRDYSEEAAIKNIYDGVITDFSSNSEEAV